jgi:hypothetical protein
MVAMKNLMFVVGIFCLFIGVFSSNPTIALSAVYDEASATPINKSLQHSDIDLLAERYTINRKTTKAKITVYKKITNFRGVEKSRVLGWINHQFVYRTTPYCWRKSQDRGIGIAPETRCAKGRDKYGALCYNKCPDGYKRQNITASNFSCIQANCPGGYQETVENICQIKRPQLKGDLRCKQGWSKCKLAKNSCCKKGYVEAKKRYCPDKYYNTGSSCQIKPKYENITRSYAGGKEKQSRYTEPYPLINYCKSNRELQAGLCYEKCERVMNDTNYHGIATVCWQNCPPAMVGCAAGCASSKAQCAMSTTNQVMSVALVANTIYGKYAEAYPAAQKATSEMTAFEIAMQEFTEKATAVAAKYSKEIDTFNDLMLYGGIFAELATAMNELVKASGSTPLSDVIDRDDYREVVAVIEPGSPAYSSLTQAWVAHYMQMVLVDLGITLGTTFVTTVDPTGIVSLVDNYAKPLCSTPESFPLAKRAVKVCPQGFEEKKYRGLSACYKQ